MARNSADGSAESAGSSAKPRRISIVVPNYNGGKTIEATLRSILDQCYPNLELIVMDGGSKDNSVEIIKKYEQRIAYWESVRDRGQSHAINKGFAKSTGDVVNWLCSDDLLEPGALATVGRIFQDDAVDWAIGKGQMVFPDRPDLDSLMWPTDEEVKRTAVRVRIAQPSAFFRRRLLDRQPPVQEGCFYTMDQELWCYFLSKGVRWRLIDETLSVAVQDGNNKTRTADYRYYVESDRIYRKYWKGGGKPPWPRWFRMSIGPLAVYAERHSEDLRGRIADYMIRRIGQLQKWWRRRPRLLHAGNAPPKS